MTDKDYKLIQKRRLLTERGHRIFEWAIEEALKYKGTRVFPFSLTDYYKKPEDVEIAAILEILVPDPLNPYSPKRQDYITELHNLIGDRPSRMVAERNFLHLLPAADWCDHIIGKGGFQKSDVFNILDWIWEMKYIKAPLHVALLEYAGQPVSNLLMPELRDRISCALNPCAVKMALMRLCLHDGIGMGVWSVIPPSDLPCPVDASVLRMVRCLYPIGRVDEGNMDEILTFIGFDVPCEFIYLYLACKEYTDEMRQVGVRLRNTVNGRIGPLTWHKFYKDGEIFLPVLTDKKRKL